MKRIVVLLLLTAVAAADAVAGDPHHALAVSDDARFEFLKSLDGTWVGTGLEDGQDGVYEFRVTAGGTAVLEIEMVGTPMEMVTLYSMEHDSLVATHYCMLGNRPRLEAAPKRDDRAVQFACSGVPGNATSHDEHHVHGWSMRLDDDGRLHYDAELVESGTVTHAPKLVLTRQARNASR